MGDVPKKKKAFEVPDCYKIKSYEKILGERQNTCKSWEKRKKQLSVQSRVRRLKQEDWTWLSLFI